MALIAGFSPNSDEQNGIPVGAALGFQMMRSHDKDYNQDPATMEANILLAAQSGIETVIMIGFDAAPPNAGTIGAMAARFGPGGTFWGTGAPGAGLGANATRFFELGNENSYSYSPKPGLSGGTAYAVYAQQAYNAVQAANTACGVLLQGDDGNQPNGSEWVDRIFNQWPAAGSSAAGWVIHPYGVPADATARLNRMASQLAARGLSSPLVFVTEDGIASDNGATLSNNYGWPLNLTYSQAATQWQTKLDMYDGRSNIFFVSYYQSRDQQPSGTGLREDYFGMRKSDGVTNKGALTTTHSSWAASHPRSSGNPSGQPPPGVVPGWTQIFVDDFTTDVASWGTCTTFAGGRDCPSLPAVYRDKWWAFPPSYQDTRQKISGDGGFYNTSNLSMSGSMLHLVLKRSGGVSQSAEPQPKIPTTGGFQTYGRYAIRFKSDSNDVFKVAWLLWRETASWGEIDFPEADLNSTISAFNHHADGSQSAFGSTTTFGDGAWHTAITEWSPGLVKFILDGVTIGQDTGGNVPSSPMTWSIQSETKLSGVIPASTSDTNIWIDWVSVWAPATGAGTIYTKTGKVLTGSRLSGADIFTATETGSVFTAHRASGVKTQTNGAGGTNYTKTGSVRAGSRASGARVGGTSATVLENFNRADGPISGSTSSSGRVWSTTYASGPGAMPTDYQIISNQLGTIGVPASGYLTGVSDGPDVSYTAEVGAPPTTGNIAFFLRLQSPGTATYSSYFCVWLAGTGWQIYRVLSGTSTQLGATVAGNDLLAGDAFKAEAIGSTITMYRRTGGVWTSIISRTDANITAAGPVGFQINGTAARIDDLSGGTVVAAPGLTYTKTGTAVAGARSSAADAYTATETGKTLAGTRESGSHGSTSPRTGSVLIGSSYAWLPDDVVTPDTVVSPTGSGAVLSGARTSGAAAAAKAGLVASGSRALGADVFTATETGSALAGSRSSAADVFTAAKTGKALSGALGSAADLFTGTRTGSVLTGSRASGADAFEATETGKAIAAGTLEAGTADITVSRAGSVLAGTRDSGADAFTADRTGSAIAGSRESGTSLYSNPAMFNKAGSAISGASATGADVFAPTETGSLLAGALGSAADVFTASETGSVLAGSRASGFSNFTLGTVTYVKTGSLIAGASASAADVYEATETGVVQAGSSESAADVFEATKTASPAAGSQASAPDIFTATEIGSAIVGSPVSMLPDDIVTPDSPTSRGALASGASQYVSGAVTYTKTGLVAAGPKPSGADLYISTEIGLLVLGSLFGAGSEAMQNRAGIVAAGARATGGFAQHSSYVKASVIGTSDGLVHVIGATSDTV